MATVRVSELVWTAQVMQLPESDGKVIGLPNIRLSEEPMAENIRLVQIHHNRTNALICNIEVSPDDEAEFRRFENAVLASKLVL